MPNRISKAIIRANKATASLRAKPNIVIEVNCCLRDGFLATPCTKAPNTIPIPTPDPKTPIVASPPPINFADWYEPRREAELKVWTGSEE